MKKKSSINVLHWPSAYTEPMVGKPYDNIFVKEHILSVDELTNSKILYVSNQDCQNGWFQKNREIEDGVDTIRLYFSKKLPLQFLNVFIRLVLMRELFTLWFKDGFKPDVIHVHFYQSALWAFPFAKLLNAKKVITEHWTAFVDYPPISMNRFVEAAKAFQQADVVLPVSQHLALGITHKTGVDLRSKATIIHNSVDTSIFHYQLAKPNSIPQLLFVGRIDTQKNIPMLIQTIGYLYKQSIACELTIIGGGDSTPLNQLATDLNIAHLVTFKGIQSKEMIAGYMQQSDVLVLSSIAENSPCVIGEALCCGLPVLSTNVGGVSELLNESNGCLIEGFEVKIYADILMRMLDQKWDKSLIAQNAAKHFSREAIGQQIINVYKTL